MIASPYPYSSLYSIGIALLLLLAYLSSLADAFRSAGGRKHFCLASYNEQSCDDRITPPDLTSHYPFKNDAFRNNPRFATPRNWSPVSTTALLASSTSSVDRVDLTRRLIGCLDKQQEEKEPQNEPSGSGENENKSLLPIFDVLESVRMSLVSKPNLLLQAAPGAGKTTIVPLQLLLDQLQLAEDDNRQILVVAPRRVAVRSAAQRMTALIGDNAPGGTVGYAMRDEVRVGTSTLIKVVTDGVLLNMLKGDPELNGISIVVLDEFHERGVGSDTSLALLREVQQNFREDDLKIVVMSATLLGNAGEDDNEEVENGSGESESTGSKLMRTLGGSSSCGIVESEGRQYPIQLRWANEVVQIMSKNNNAGGGRNGIPPLGSLLRDRKSLIQTAANVVERAALKEAPERGDVLVFLPGAAECRGVVRELNSRSTVTNIADVYSLYGAMPKEDQDEVLYPSRPQKGNVNDGSARRQRVIVSTPIAEASLTIPSVTCVVDSGLRREPRCDADTGMPRLVSARISKASAIQRMGRAGRVREGSCLRLYTETDFEKDFEEQSPPEIASTDLAPILLLLADWGVSTLAEILHEMPFVDPPEEQSLERAERFLVDIGALEKIDSNRFKMTELGRKISKMPCHPRLAACISGAMNRDDEDPTVLAASIAAAFCLDDESSVQRGGNQDDPNLAYTISSLLQISSKFSSFLRFSGRVGGSRGKAVAQALQANEDDFVRRSISNLGKAMLPGFVDLVGERKGDASYDSSNYFLALGKSSRLGFRKSPPYILAVETNTGPDGISRVRSYVSLTKFLLEDIAVDRELLYTVPSKGYQVRAKQVNSVGSIELSSAPLPSPSPDEVSKALLEAMNKDLGGIANALLKFLTPKDKSTVDELITRIRLDKELTRDENNWPQCFEAFDASTSDNGSLAGNNGLDSSTQNEILTDLVEPWLGSVKSLKELKTLDILRSTLSPEQQKYLDDSYPTFVDAPDASRVPVRYIRNQPKSSGDSGKIEILGCRPMATAKLQQFFGVQETPVVGPSNGTKMPLTLSLVSPAGKPLAETSDLPFFWSEVYPSIRSEMRGRYPKHPWPDDPLQAVATRKTKKQLSYEDTGTEERDKKGKGKGSRRSRRKKK